MRSMGTARRKATIAGEMTYNTGQPCKYGHNSPRYTDTRVCVECAKSTESHTITRQANEMELATLLLLCFLLRSLYVGALALLASLAFLVLIWSFQEIRK